MNWFRKAPDGSYLWPGYGDNSRVLAWALDRCVGEAPAHESPIGLVPTSDALDVTGTHLTPDDVDALLEIDTTEWRAEIVAITEYYAQLGDRVPTELHHELRRLERAIS